jgi:glycosyltransferase involved in cell wall biosynthesis
VPWPIEVAGDTTHPNGAECRFEHVRSLGRLSADTLAEHLATSAIYALPARYEPFGLSVLEAALSGCALVLGDIASLREIWGDAAVFVPPDDHQALARALNEMIENDTVRAEFAQRARSRALNFSTERMTADYLAAYSHCLTNRRQEVAA